MMQLDIPFGLCNIERLKIILRESKVRSRLAVRDSN